MAFLSGLDLRDPAHARVSWQSSIRILEDEDPIAMQARELGRTTLLIEGRMPPVRFPMLTVVAA
jgi:hypothetical protein